MENDIKFLAYIKGPKKINSPYLNVLNKYFFIIKIIV